MYGAGRFPALMTFEYNIPAFIRVLKDDATLLILEASYGCASPHCFRCFYPVLFDYHISLCTMLVLPRKPKNAYYRDNKTY